MFQLIETKTLVIENLVKPNLKLFKNKSHVTWFKNDYVKSYIYTFNLIYFSSIIKYTFFYLENVFNKIFYCNKKLSTLFNN